MGEHTLLWQAGRRGGTAATQGGDCRGTSGRTTANGQFQLQAGTLSCGNGGQAGAVQAQQFHTERLRRPGRSRGAR